MNVTRLMLMAGLVVTPAAIFAQNTTPTPGKNDYNINQRKVDQQERIANGVRSGELTPWLKSGLETC